MNATTFLSSYPQSFESDPDVLNDAAFRESIYQHLHPQADESLLPLIRVLFQHELHYRQAPPDDGEYFENIYWTALFLYQFGSLADVLPMWRAKQSDMDLGTGFSVQFLVGHGVSETMEYLQELGTGEADAAVEYLRRCENAGDFDNLDEWLAATIAYFR